MATAKKPVKKMNATYWSMDEYAAMAEAHGECGSSKVGSEWSGNVTWDECLGMARKGWNEELDSALELAESAVTMAEKEHMVDSFNQPQWDVTGAQVDIGAYLAGTPECMVDYPLTETSKSGRIIALCASVCYSRSVYPETIQRRGRTMVALALALGRMGHNTEMWADISGGKGGEEVRVRILVKGADDELDPAKVMFAYAHPAMLRILGFSALDKLSGSTFWYPIPPKRDLPEGTIYLPEICSDRDVPEAEEFLRVHLGELGLLAE